MNLVDRYRKSHKLEKVMLINNSNNTRLICGCYVEPKQSIVLDVGTASTFLAMIPDRSWASIYPIYNSKEVGKVDHVSAHMSEDTFNNPEYWENDRRGRRASYEVN